MERVGVRADDAAGAGAAAPAALGVGLAPADAAERAVPPRDAADHRGGGGAARRRRSRAVSVSLAAALTTLGLAACGSSDYRAACVDRATNTRIDDAQCRDGSAGHGWYYFPRGASYGGVGSRLSGGSTTVPDGASVDRGGLSSKGGTVSRGGFGGGSSKSVGG